MATTTDKEHIVLIEDDTSNREAFRRVLERAGLSRVGLRIPGPGLEELSRAGDVALVVTDLMMPGKDGMFVLSEARRIDPDIGLLMVTARDSATMGFEASQKGADDYLVKDQFDLAKLRHTVQAILEKRRLKQEVTHLRRRIESESLGGLIGRTPSMQRLYQQIQMVAPTRSTVLIVGDSGTGKELVANAIHEHSPRRQERFLPINCGAIPSEILESELFGHEKGSFTGAASRKIGKFELADRGTIFLDEIAELPPDMQVKLLRVLEGMEFMRVGGARRSAWTCA
jgi:DNA-binding NtrC family response regulator